ASIFALRTKRGRSKAVFVDSGSRTIHVVVLVRFEARVPPGAARRRIRARPIAGGPGEAVAFMIRDPPTMEIEGTGGIGVRRKRAVATLEGCLPVMTAATVQGDGSVRTLPRCHLAAA